MDCNAKPWSRVLFHELLSNSVVTTHGNVGSLKIDMSFGYNIYTGFLSINVEKETSFTISH
jgi:hypothetical protein